LPRDLHQRGQGMRKKTLGWYDVFWQKSAGYSRVLAASAKEARSIAQNHCDQTGIFDVGKGRIVETIWHDVTDEEAYISEVMKNIVE
jgi:hypothetical protein